MPLTGKSAGESETMEWRVPSLEVVNEFGARKPNDRVDMNRTFSAAGRLGLFGCPLDTGNLGVSALGLATILGLHRAGQAVDVVMFDYGRGTRVETLDIGNESLNVRRVGCYYSRRLYSTSNTAQMLIAAKLGLRRFHPMLRRLSELNAILDVSGGDSFSDIYGLRRFRSVSLPKRLALTLGMRLILLPQTYGPFRSWKSRRVTQSILRNASQVWARDARSHETVRELLGDEFDPRRHRCGVDVAFGLPAVQPRDSAVVESVGRFRDARGVRVGLNVSGLLYNDSEGGAKRFGLGGSYRELIDTLVDRLVAREDVQIMLIPHVAPQRPSVDCDVTACAALFERLSAQQRKRTLAVPPTLGPMEVKWVIGQTDWFCGTRMHSCIAALSQGVPTTAFAYSDKTQGVFATAGIGDAVVDLRTGAIAQAVEQSIVSMGARDETARRLREHLPCVNRLLGEQFQSIIAGIGQRL